MSCDSDSIFPLGSLVVVKRGKYAGLMCAVIATDANAPNNGKILVADGTIVSVRRPKRKNAKHLERTGVISAEVADRLARGKKLDDGWLHAALLRHKR